MSTAMPRGLAIQRLAAVDTDALGKFFELLGADSETTRFFHPHPLTRAFAMSLCARQETARDRYSVLRYHGKIIAYSMLRGWDEGYAIPSFGGCTHPELRGAGLGHLLLRHAVAESRAAGAPQLRLTVYKENERAVRIYRAFGFDFADKNQHEFVGLLDVRAHPPNNPRGADTRRLDAWLKSQREDPSDSLPPTLKRSA